MALTADEAAQRSFASVLDLLPTSDAVAVRDATTKRLSFRRLRKLVEEADLAALGLFQGSRVVSLLPNGPIAATAHMVISQYCVHAPLNVNLVDSEMAFEFSDLPADAIVVQKGEAINVRVLTLAAEMNKPVIELVPSASELGCFALRWLERRGVRDRRSKTREHSLTLLCQRALCSCRRSNS
jgi:acyl-coenzyme A synthetase/AMP-(fatty) acid ligase